MSKKDEEIFNKSGREVNAYHDFLIELGLPENTIDYAIRILYEFYDTGADLAIPYSHLRSLFDMRTETLLNYMADAIRSAFRSGKSADQADLSKSTEKTRQLAEKGQADFDAALQHLEEKGVLKKETRMEPIYQLTEYGKATVLPKWAEFGPPLPPVYGKEN